MISFAQTLQASGVAAYVQIGLLLPALVWALVCAVLVGMRWKVPPIVAGAPLFVVPLVHLIGATWAFGRVEDALVVIEPARRASLLAAGVSEMLGLSWFGLGVLPVAFVLAVGALAAGVRGPRAWGVPAITLLVAGATALLPAFSLLFHASLPAVALRVPLYGLCAIPFALAVATAEPKRNGPEAGMLAAMAWISLVGSVELAHAASLWRAGFAALANVDPGQRGELLAALVEEVGTQQTFGWILLFLAALPAVAVAFRPTPPMTDEEISAGNVTPSPWRSVGRVLGLGLWVLWAVAWGASSPVSALMDVVRLSSP